LGSLQVQQNKMSEEFGSIKKEVETIKNDLATRMDTLESKMRGASLSSTDFVPPGQQGSAAIGSFGRGPTSYVPCEIRVQGFSPYGTPKSDMLKKPDYEMWGKKFLSVLPQQLLQHVNILPPGPFNFRLTFKVLGGEQHCNYVQNYFRQYIDTHGVTILGHTPKVSIRSSPQRELQLKLWFRAKEAMAGIDATKWTEDNRSLSILALPNGEVAGSVDRVSGLWTWDHAICEAMGFDDASHPITSA
jgi:hypothetical protein